ncbi:MAG: hypothetical protein Q8L55_00700 [Phycisphaerales bacterium]|nr:hypothetical protein [Phycisphaerales bacterium]
MAATATKVCTVCNADCADRPRVKDEHGRYTCKACLNRQARSAAAPAPKVVPPPMQHGFDDDGLDLRSAAMIEAKTQPIDLPEAQSCPKCHGFMSGEQRLCMRCGYDRKRGSRVTTRVERQKAEKEERREPLDVTWIVVGFGLLTVGCAVSALVTSAMAVPALLLLSALGFGLYITIIACQFRDGETVYAVCAILSFFVGITGFVTLFWLFAVNDRGWLKGLWACMLVSYVTLFIAVLSNPETAEAIRDFYGLA